jgi:hypothetical protein
VTVKFESRQVLMKDAKATVFLPREVDGKKAVLIHTVSAFDGQSRSAEKIVGRKVAAQEWAKLTADG